MEGKKEKVIEKALLNDTKMFIFGWTIPATSKKKIKSTSHLSLATSKQRPCENGTKWSKWKVQTKQDQIKSVQAREVPVPSHYGYVPRLG